jgi:hypothetical protein
MQASSSMDALADVQQRINGVLAMHPDLQMAALSIGSGGANGNAMKRPNRSGTAKLSRTVALQVGDRLSPSSC